MHIRILKSLREGKRHLLDHVGGPLESWLHVSTVLQQPGHSESLGKYNSNIIS